MGVENIYDLYGPENTEPTSFVAPGFCGMSHTAGTRRPLLAASWWSCLAKETIGSRSQSDWLFNWAQEEKWKKDRGSFFLSTPLFRIFTDENHFCWFSKHKLNHYFYIITFLLINKVVVVVEQTGLRDDF